jgi:hypothetical protein
MEKLIHKLKGKQTDYEALMVEDYEHKTLSEIDSILNLSYNYEFKKASPSKFRIGCF